MSKEKTSKLSLNSLLDQYDVQLQKREEEVIKEKTAKNDFIDQFYGLRDNLIRPTFDKLKKVVEDRGHKAQIKDEKQFPEKGNTTDPRIAFFVELKNPNTTRGPIRYNHEFPHISFIANASSKKVWCHESTMGPRHGGHSGSRGSFDLKDITEELIETQFLEWFKQIV